MKYKFCKNCEYQLKPSGGYENHPESLCRAPGYERMNFVTGEKYLLKCKKINTTGKCGSFCNFWNIKGA